LCTLINAAHGRGQGSEVRGQLQKSCSSSLPANIPLIHVNNSWPSGKVAACHAPPNPLALCSNSVEGNFSTGSAYNYATFLCSSRTIKTVSNAING